MSKNSKFKDLEKFNKIRSFENELCFVLYFIHSLCYPGGKIFDFDRDPRVIFFGFEIYENFIFLASLKICLTFLGT